MKYFIAVSALCVLLCCGNGLRAQDAMSVWTPAPVAVDGHVKEWPSFFRFYISGAKVMFDFYNDSNYLYIAVKAIDIAAQNRLMHAGMNIWFDPTGKKKQKEGISFPVKMDGAPGDLPQRQRPSRDPSDEPSEKSRVSKLRQSVLFAQGEIKVTGMIDVKEPLISLQNKYGIEVAYDWDSLDILCIEYKIPLSLIYQHPVTGADLTHPMGLGFVVGAMEAPHPTGAPQSSGQGGGQRGGGGGNGMGGGRGGSSNGRGMTNNLADDRYNTDYQEQKAWLKVHFETKPATTQP